MGVLTPENVLLYGGRVRIKEGNYREGGEGYITDICGSEGGFATAQKRYAESPRGNGGWVVVITFDDGETHDYEIRKLTPVHEPPQRITRVYFKHGGHCDGVEGAREFTEVIHSNVIRRRYQISKRTNITDEFNKAILQRCELSSSQFPYRVLD